MRRLALASRDARVSSGDPQRGEDGDNILHIMTNLLLFSRLKQRRPSEQSRPLDDIPANYSLLPTHAMTVFVRDGASVIDLGQELAGEYIFDAITPSEACNKNAEVARKHGRRDHEDLFVSLGLLLSSYSECSPKAWGTSPLACSFIKQMSVGKCSLSVQILTSYTQVREIRTGKEHSDAGYDGHTTFENA